MTLRIPNFKCGLKSVVITTVHDHILVHTGNIDYIGADSQEKLDELSLYLKTTQFTGNQRFLKMVEAYNKEFPK